MAWWDHEELKAPKDRPDKYITSFPSEYTREEVEAAQERLMRQGLGHTPTADDTSHHRWKGIHKITEEIGELGQVIGKINVFPDGDHPDGKGSLFDRMSDELDDVEAAICYFRDKNNMPRKKERFTDKLAKFHKWGLSGIL